MRAISWDKTFVPLMGIPVDLIISITFALGAGLAGLGGVIGAVELSMVPGEDTRLLVNLPPSHVGGQAEQLMTTLFEVRAHTVERFRHQCPHIHALALQNELAARMAGFDHLVRFADILQRKNGGDLRLNRPAINQLSHLGQCLSSGRR